MVLDETVVSLLDGNCQKQMISPVVAYVVLFYHRDGRAEGIWEVVPHEYRGELHGVAYGGRPSHSPVTRLWLVHFIVIR